MPPRSVGPNTRPLSITLAITAIVTGALRGILSGRSHADVPGAFSGLPGVVVNDLTQAAADRVAAEIVAAGFEPAGHRGAFPVSR